MFLRLVGPVTQEDYRAVLEKKAAELGVSDRLELAGALKSGSKELVAEYRGADVFVLPSRHEPFGIVVLEAWAAGTPVAASSVGGLGRLVAAHPGAAASFSPDDPASLDAAIAYALDNAAQLRTAGLAAAKEYDWKRLSEKLVAFYRQIPNPNKSQNSQ